MPPQIFSLDEAEANLERMERGQAFQEQAEEWSSSLRLFVEHAWTDGLGIPDRFVRGWHVDAICEHLEAVTAGEIRRLAICVPPGSSKSTVTSVCWPAWEWTRDPTKRYLTASHVRKLSTKFCQMSRDLIVSDWYQSRWEKKFRLKEDENLKTAYKNTRGGYRESFPVGEGTGFHGDRLLIDDAHNASEALSNTERLKVIEWHAGTISVRFATQETASEVIIGQRLHERDLIGYELARAPEEWTVLCLPEEWERKHPLRTPPRVRLPSGRLIKGDPREVEGELLCPGRRNAKEHARVAAEMSSYRAAGQLQQRPAAREGEILKRHYWKFFPARLLEDDGLAHLPRFHGLVGSWDTAFKDKNQNDYVAGALFGLSGAHLYLLATRVDRMSVSQTKQAIRDMTGWAEKRWPLLPLRILVENKTTGPEIIQDMRSEIRGIVPINDMGDKVARAERAEPAFEGGNVWLPGSSDPDLATFYNPEATPGWAQDVVEQCAIFPHGEHDDLVDAVTQAVNWSRGAGRRSKATFGRPRGAMPERGSMAAAASR